MLCTYFEPVDCCAYCTANYYGCMYKTNTILRTSQQQGLIAWTNLLPGATNCDKFEIAVYLQMDN